MQGFDKFLLIRCLIVISCISLLVLNTIYGTFLQNSNVTCFKDKSFEMTDWFNKYLHDNVRIKNAMIIFSSLCIDFVVLFSCIRWIIKGRSWRMIVVLALFYLNRLIFQYLFQMSYPDGYLWSYPGIPSLVISYLKTNDFFISGHVGLCIIFALEFKKEENIFMFVTCLFISLIESFTMIVTRGHYIIDIATGIIFAHYIFIIVDWYIQILDDSCLSMKEQGIFDEESIPLKADLV